ncbi:MAG: hypothetical protein M3Z46_06495 [Actinomycetota bacterium]|nr:hypothetical protein [Actinomycetota bacterium]
MSPVAQSGNHAGRALAVATIGVLVLMGGLFLASLALSSRKSSDLRLGDATFQGGGTARLAAEIADRGPIFYGDVSGEKDRDIILQHLGPDPDKGWYAFLAAPTDKPRSCTWEYQKRAHRFRAACDHTRFAPADGKGLSQFPVTVREGKLSVDLNADRSPSTEPG